MDFEKLAVYRNQQNAFGRQLGIHVEEVHQGYARVTKTVCPEDVNPLGVAHGGVYFSMADTACGSAAAAYGCMAVTVNASYNYFRSAHPGDRLTAEAREVKSGRTLCVFDVQVTDPAGVLLGSGTFTFYIQRDKPLPI